MSENSNQVQTKPIKFKIKKFKIKKIAKINSKKENEDYSVLINNSDSYLDDINQYCHKICNIYIY